MYKQVTKREWRLKALAIALAAIGSGAAHADNLPALGDGDDPWRVDVIYENGTHYRGKDKTGHEVGLSKFRNTIQVELDKKLANDWGFHGVLRGTFDGVYRLNDDEFGKKAGSKSGADLQFQNTISKSGGMVTTVPWGGGLGANGGPWNQATAAFGYPGGNDLLNAIYAGNVIAGSPLPLPLPGAANTGFVNGNTYSAESGVGLRMLGDRWHGPDGGIQMAVPVRPCDTDRRGCRDFGGYGDKNLSELEAPEFNDRLDFIREAYVKKTFNLTDETNLFLKLGKQQVVWGRTDLFRVLDVINPVDYSRNNIYDELQDIRIPMWIAQTEFRFGSSELMQDRNLSIVWNFDKFRANNLGQCGTPNVMLDAGCFFRGMANLWDNGGTVANFAHLSDGAASLAELGMGIPNGSLPRDMWLATNFGPGQIGIRKVHLPEWSLANSQLGVKFEGVTQGGLNFSLNALTYRSQLPSLHAFNNAQNPFVASQTGGSSHLIAFDMYFPRVNLIGGSMDFQSETLGAAFRLEGALTKGEEFVNTARPKLYSSNKVWRSVIGVDRPTFIPFISESRTTLISAQLFYQHIFDHEEYRGPLGKYGMPDWQDNFIGTLLIKAFLMNDRVSPQLVTAYDFKAHAWVASPQVEWSLSDSLKLTFGANVKGKRDDAEDRWAFNDCRDCNPYAPYTQYDGQTGAGPLGLSGLEPLGRFRAGPIGSAWKENEIYFYLRYKF
ncbi:MAG: DUF1302 domain-containing protein [Azonexus sp.]|jgi:hypothetical protein|nr:DUF1302 domain-containing protein [Azonexus sp.]